MTFEKGALEVMWVDRKVGIAFVGMPRFDLFAGDFEKVEPARGKFRRMSAQIENVSNSVSRFNARCNRTWNVHFHDFIMLNSFLMLWEM